MFKRRKKNAYYRRLHKRECIHLNTHLKDCHIKTAHKNEKLKKNIIYVLIET